MITPLILLFLLVAPYLVVRAAPGWGARDSRRQTAGVMGIALLFVFSGIGHFAETEGMVAMLPGWVPGRVTLIYLTGLLEFALAAGVLLPRSRRVAGWITLAMLLAFLPVNVYAALAEAPMGGHAWGPVYLLVRVPLQLVIMGWIYRFACRAGRSRSAIGQ